MFDLHGNERLTEWRRIRDRLEHSSNAFEELANLWSGAPLVNQYLNPNDPTSWPDPWHLVLDNKYDDLAICLGMLYTLQLTQRFMASKYEIHMSINSYRKEPLYFLVVDKKNVLNLCYRTVCSIDNISDIESDIIWSR